MINIMNLRQLYEKQKITKIIQIHEINSLTEFMIKTKSFNILKTIIETNRININTTT